MKRKFRIYINGINFLIRFEGKLKKHGFYTTRYTVANNESEAELVVIDLIKNELKEIVLNQKSNPPVLKVQETVELESFDGVDIPGKGFTWYEE